MPAIFGDASQVYKLANDLSMVGAKAVVPMRAAMVQAGEIVRDNWRDIARTTAGEHGVHYPNSIEATPTIGFSTIGVDIGPNAGMKQGGMSFEFGSRNQPPHLDGLHAVEFTAGRVERLIDTATTYLFQ